ncbi:MAG: hypothetical protein FJ313_02000 [Gemmatimonadetes bacterium]|nr:hypothetical protein [Gemmatimonadota bacterium]
MEATGDVIREVPGLYQVIRFVPLRRTKSVAFDWLPLREIGRIDAIDRVMHGPGAFSPGSVGEVERPWYMHPHQDDHLLVLHGTRHVEIYTAAHGRIERFIAEPDRIEMNGELLYDGPAVLVWPRGVFHRIISGESGSASVNLATHHEGFDIRTNFNVYDLDPATGRFECIREGHLDQGGLT